MMYIDGKLKPTPVATLAILVLPAGKAAKRKRCQRYWFYKSLHRRF